MTYFIRQTFICKDGESRWIALPQLKEAMSNEKCFEKLDIEMRKLKIRGFHVCDMGCDMVIAYIHEHGEQRLGMYRISDE